MNTSSVFYWVEVGILMVLAGLAIIGRNHLRSLFSTPEPVGKRRVYGRRTCGYCGKSYAVSQHGVFMHHNSARCAADHRLLAKEAAGPIPGAEKE